MPLPIWYRPEESSELTRSTPRHQWMCAQLLARRRLQAENSPNVLVWLAEALQSGLGRSIEIRRVFEVLSDGLGYIEPNWHATDVGEAQPNGTSDLAQVVGLRKRIKEYRSSLQGFHGMETQRGIGGRLYESGLFLVTPEVAYFLSRGRWQEVQKSPLPLKSEEDQVDGEAARRTIDESLRLLSKHVLWPAFFENTEGFNFSLVYLHTSLWQSVAGVWAFHAACGSPVGSPIVQDEGRFRRLVEPAIRCLDDVVGWANENEGSHTARRKNVDLFFRSTARQPPEWTAEGVRGAFEEDDRWAYELTPSAGDASDSRKLFRRAVTLLAKESKVTRPLEAPDPPIPQIIRSLQGLFVAGRLLEDRAIERDSEEEDLPSLGMLTLDYALRECTGMATTSLETGGVEVIGTALADRIGGIESPGWRAWCAVAFRVVCLAGFVGASLAALATELTDAEALVVEAAGHGGKQWLISS